MVLAKQIADESKYVGGKRRYFPKEPLTPNIIAENGDPKYHSI